MDLDNLQQLIRDCAGHDRKSQEKLYKQFYPPLYCLCRRFFQNEHEAIESVNDGMLKVFKNIGSYDAGVGRFYNWVYTIVRNTALDKVRASVPFVEHADNLIDVAQSDPGYDPLRVLEWKDMYVLLDLLPPATRAVCSLFYMEGYAVKDIAGQLNISEGTVKWHLSESRKKMKVNMERYFN